MFITLEGIEGSGKSTQIEAIRQYLEGIGISCMITREPGGTRIGEGIRRILLNAENTDIAPLTELLLYFADRAQHLNERILPALRSGQTVVCDRFFDATLVYQGYARGLDLGFILDLHRFALNDVKPDLTLLLDLEPEVGLSRAWQGIEDGHRNIEESRFEAEALSFHENVRAGYLDLARCESERFRIIDGSGDADQVRDVILQTLSEEIERRR